MNVGVQLARRRPGRIALLAIDLITDFAFKDGAAIHKAALRCKPAISRLLERARAARAAVIYVNDNHGSWRSDAPQLVEACSSTPRGGDFGAALSPHPQDLIVLKPRHSAFFGTPLEALLESERIGTLVLAGISAESCVWMTACDAHTRGYRLIVPMDTMASVSAKTLNATLTGLHSTLGARTPRSQASVRFE